MKFKNSTYEDRYNEYWNNNVVTVDNLIRSASLGFKLFDDLDIGTLIVKYQQHVQNILSNLERQADMFEDKDYIKEYKQNTIAQTVEDFSFYAIIHPEYSEMISKILKDLGVPTENRESSPNYN